ncbi:MAG: signal peptidase II [Clostridia bacterium]|nr:signal peptidase II [Clostridia bacterium]
MTTKKRVVRFIVQLIAIGVLIGLDQLIKRAVELRLKGAGTKVLIKGVLGLRYAENTGAAFSLFNSSTAALSVVTAVAMLAGLVALFVIKKKALIYEITVPLIIAGGAGNLIDRLTRGYVIDYIMTLFVNFPIFNFADCLITCSCIAIMIWLIYEIVRDSKPKPAGDAPAEAAPAAGPDGVPAENDRDGEAHA